MFIVIQIVGATVISDVEIGPAVIVVIRPNSLHAEIGSRIVDASLFRNLLKGPVPPIAEQQVRFPGVTTPGTFHGDAREIAKLVDVLWLGQLAQVHTQVARYKQVYIAIPVVVSPGRTGAVSSGSQTSLLRHVLEFAVA